MLEDRPHSARLIGALLTDGGISFISGKIWRIHFTSTSPTLTEIFRKDALRILDRKTSKQIRNNAVIQKSPINKLIKEFYRLSPSWRTQPCNSFPICPCQRGFKIHENHIKLNGRLFPPTKIPDFIFEDNSKAKEFLKIAFTCDGSVLLWVGKAEYGFRIDRRVELSCYHPLLKEQYAVLLNKFGIKTKIRWDKVVISKRENLEKFYKNIGFVKGVKITSNGRWGGVEKAELLKLCIKSFKMSNIFKLNSVQEIYKFLNGKLISRTGDRLI